jgi:hypothetical protein
LKQENTYLAVSEHILLSSALIIQIKSMFLWRVFRWGYFSKRFCRKIALSF